MDERMPRAVSDELSQSRNETAEKTDAATIGTQSSRRNFLLKTGTLGAIGVTAAAVGTGGYLPDFCDKLQSAANDPFYAAIAVLTRDLMTLEKALLEGNAA